MALAPSDMYIGTYAEGVYRVRLDTETGALSEPSLAAEATGPSYVALAPGGKFLYALNEYSDGEVSSFAVSDGRLKKLNTVKFDGKGPAHVSVDASGKWLFVSAYGGGTLTVLPLLEDGSIGPASGHFQNEGSGPNKARQDRPHMHFAASVGKFVYACDLGTDEILEFSLDGGKLQKLGEVKPPPGSGPRHFVVSRDGKTLYSNNEMGMSVSVFDRNPANGLLRLVQTVSTGVSPAQGFSTAAIHPHPRLPVLYVSNRGHNSIAVFGIQPDGLLKLQTVQTLDVKEPRDFNIDPSGQWLIVAGQSSGELLSLKLDTAGLPGAVGGRCKMPKPVCVAFGVGYTLRTP